MVTKDNEITINRLATGALSGHNLIIPILALTHPKQIDCAPFGRSPWNAV